MDFVVFPNPYRFLPRPLKIIIYRHPKILRCITHALEIVSVNTQEFITQRDKSVWFQKLLLPYRRYALEYHCLENAPFVLQGFMTILQLVSHGKLSLCVIKHRDMKYEPVYVHH